MDRAYRRAYGGAHRLQVRLGAGSHFAWTTAISLVGFPTLLTVHQHRPLPQWEGHRPKETACQPNPTLIPRKRSWTRLLSKLSTPARRLSSQHAVSLPFLTSPSAVKFHILWATP